MKYSNDLMNKIIQGDTLIELKKLPSDSVDTIITSPPYWGLRDYGIEGQIGLEKTLGEFIEKLLKITAELKRVLKPTGVMFWNHGDCYSGNSSYSSKGRAGFEEKEGMIKHYLDPKLPARKRARETVDQSTIISKCLVMQNYRLILKMIDQQGWILRNTIVWHKPNHMPSSVKDRFANSYEPVFMLVKNKRYWFDLDAVRVAITTSENRPMGVERERDYPNAKRNKNSFNYRVREAKKGHTGIVGVKASKEEMERYNKKGQTKIPKEQAESFGSPRARYWRKGSRANNSALNNRNFMPIKSQKFITPDQQKETQDKTGWIEGSGRVRSFFDNFGGKTNPKGKNPGDMWKIATQPFPEAHFATFPEKLIEPMILSSCPKEICKKCGKTRERIVKLGNYSKEPKRGTQPSSKRAIGSPQQSTGGGMPIREKETVGWTNCKCEAGFEAGIVFDPFIGSGTVAIVAKRLGRNYLGIELSEEYIKIAKARIKAQPVPLF